jgi:hypothetical protein
MTSFDSTFGISISMLSVTKLWDWFISRLSDMVTKFIVVRVQKA